MGVALPSSHFILIICARYGFHFAPSSCETGELCQVGNATQQLRRHALIHSFIFCICQSVSQWVSLPVDKCILHAISLTLCHESEGERTTATATHLKVFLFRTHPFCWSRLFCRLILLCLFSMKAHVCMYVFVAHSSVYLSKRRSEFTLIYGMLVNARGAFKLCKWIKWIFVWLEWASECVHAFSLWFFVVD